MPVKQDLRIAVTKRMIKEALVRLLEKKSLDKVKVNELCEAAGVNRATFYRHYETLQDVLHEIEQDFAAQIPQLSRPPHDIEEAKAHMEAVCVNIYEHCELVKTLFLNRTDADMIQSIGEIYRDSLKVQMLRQTELRLDEDTLEIFIAMMSGGCYALLRQWMLKDISKTPREIADILFRVIHLPEVLGERLSDSHKN